MRVWADRLKMAEADGWCDMTLAKKLGCSRRTIIRMRKRVAKWVENGCDMSPVTTVTTGVTEVPEKPVGQGTDIKISPLSIVKEGIEVEVVEGLTPNQQRALHLIAGGWSNTRTAKEVGCSINTISKWVHHHPIFGPALNELLRTRDMAVQRQIIANRHLAVDAENEAMVFLLNVLRDNVPAELPPGLDPAVAERVQLYMDPTHHLRAAAVLKEYIKSAKDTNGMLAPQADNGAEVLALTAAGGEERLLELLTRVPRRMLTRALEMQDGEPADVSAG